MRRGRQVLGPLLAVVALSGCGGGPSPGPDQQEAASCPAELDPTGVPARPGTETVGRLVPEQPPQAALVCRYSGAGPVAEVALVGGLDRLPQDLLLPRAFAGVRPADCDAGTPSLLRLAYGDGVVWVRADGCGTGNGSFSSPVAVGDLLVASSETGSWTAPPLPDADQRCVPERTGRAGQETALLPGRPASLVLCRVAGDGVVRRTASAAQRAAVQDVLAGPVAVPAETEPGCAVGEQYELAATYAEGPAVLVRYLPGCGDEVDNGSLQAPLEPDGAARLQAVLREALGAG